MIRISHHRKGLGDVLLHRQGQRPQLCAVIGLNVHVCRDDAVQIFDDDAAAFFPATPLVPKAAVAAILASALSLIV